MLAGIGLAISGIHYAVLLTVVMFICCLAQLGPLLVLIPAVAWLYWSGDNTWATVLLVWSGVVGTMDNVLRPALIRLAPICRCCWCSPALSAVCWPLA